MRRKKRKRRNEEENDDEMENEEKGMTFRVINKLWHKEFLI